ncbi:MAG TPA: hypothetical protein VGB42_09985 [Candidatus Thermoplasmatota archaeon]
MRTIALSRMAVSSILVLVAGCTAEASERPAEHAWGHRAALGDGGVSSYAELDETGAPSVIGLAFDAAALASLPTERTDGHHCYDHDGDGALEADSECFATHERVIPLPDLVARRDDIPFRWALLNWNPGGHIPPGVYDRPHFDVHFYIAPIEDILAIESGPCGPERVRCDQFELGMKPLPVNYMPPDYILPDAVAPGMGNHLIDVTGPEFSGTPFTRAWIFGAYDGRITFYEEMVTLDHLRSAPDRCFDIKAPPAVGLSGFYPTRSCLRHSPADDTYTVSMEGFVHREAEPAGPPAPASAPPPVQHH